MNLKNKTVTLIVDDRGLHPVKKQGVVISETGSFIFLEYNNQVQGIGKNYIIRIEIKGGFKRD